MSAFSEVKKELAAQGEALKQVLGNDAVWLEKVDLTAAANYEVVKAFLGVLSEIEELRSEIEKLKERK